MTPRGGFRWGMTVLAMVAGVISMHALSVGHESGSLAAVEHTAPVHDAMDAGGSAAVMDAPCTKACAHHEPSNSRPHPPNSLCLAVLSITVALLLMASARHRTRRIFRRQRTHAVLSRELFVTRPPWTSRLSVLRI
ncbi:MAG: DUF6153 family protein [Mycobacteriales bacterium]